MERRKMCWRRLLCLTLAALVLASCLTMTAFAADPQDSEENGIVDFVLVLDCSGSLNVTDPSHLCATACKMFVDMVPLENARISVIAFGYDGGTQYILKNMSIDNPLDLKKVYLVSDMVEASAIKDKNALKQQVTDATSKSGTNTPLGTALLSAVDLLENNGASDKNACVILLTDGRIAAQQNRYDDKDNAHTAAKTAASHDWPVYTMHLNDGERYGAGSEETTLMRQIAEESGAGEDGYTPLTSFQEGNAAVARAFMNIFNRFMFGGNGNIITKTADTQGDVTCDFEVPELTSETTVIVSGASLKSVTVNGPDGSSRTVDKNNFDEQNFVATIDSNHESGGRQNKYICIKLLCPEAGMWTVQAKGDPNANIDMYDCSMRDLDLVLSTSLTDESRVLAKNEAVTFNAYFTYHGNEILKNPYYEKKQPVLVFTNTANGQKAELPMQAGANGGYAATISMNELEYQGTFTVAARLDDSMFRNGSKWSNSQSLTSENLPVRITDPKMPDLTGDVNGKTEKVDLMQHIENPDDDELFYELQCVSDRNVAFDYSIDENGYLEIECGLNYGTYALQLSVRDADMEQPLLLDPFQLETQKHAFSVRDIEPVELWTDHYPWQKDIRESAEFDLNDYYDEGDNLPVEIASESFDGDGTVYRVSRDGMHYTVVPLAEGEGTLTFTLTNQLKEEQGHLKVRVISGKAAFWQRNWIYFALAAAVLVLIVIVLCVLSGITRVKGSWEIDLEDGDGGRIYLPNLNIASNTSVGRKNKQVDLWDLVYEIAPFAEKSGLLSESLNFYPAMNQIHMRGVTFGSGFVLQKLPANVTAQYNGLPVSGKCRVSMGELRLTIQGEGAVTDVVCSLRYAGAR